MNEFRPSGSRGERGNLWCPMCGTQGWFPTPTGDPLCDNPYCDVRTFRASSWTQTPPEVRNAVHR